MCLRDLRIYTSVLNKAKPYSLHYYRDSDGLEVDTIVELRDGRWAGIGKSRNQIDVSYKKDEFVKNPSLFNYFFFLKIQEPLKTAMDVARRAAEGSTPASPV